MIVEAVIAFAGGTLTLLSPCSALLLPAFFAYAFASPGRLVARTGIFFAGLLTFLVPLGLGIGALGSLLLTRRAELTVVAGLLLVVIGLYQLAVGGFTLPGAGRLERARSGLSSESIVSTYVLGAVYGFGGFCAGPILGGVLTIAASSGGALTGAVLLAVYGAGMALPLLLLALAWNRLGSTLRTTLRTREVRIGPFRRALTTVLSSVLFIALGVAFALTQGANALAPLYAALDADTFALHAETAVRAALLAVPAGAWVAVLVAGVLLVGRSLVVRRRRP